MVNTIKEIKFGISSDGLSGRAACEWSGWLKINHNLQCIQLAAL